PRSRRGACRGRWAPRTKADNADSESSFWIRQIITAPRRESLARARSRDLSLTQAMALEINSTRRCLASASFAVAAMHAFAWRPANATVPTRFSVSQEANSWFTNALLLHFAKYGTAPRGSSDVQRDPGDPSRLAPRRRKLVKWAFRLNSFPIAATKSPSRAASIMDCRAIAKTGFT